MRREINYGANPVQNSSVYILSKNETGFLDAFFEHGVAKTEFLCYNSIVYL